MKDRRLFVAVEGPDFAGKTTICKALAEAWPKAFGRKPEDLVTAREPGGTPLGERLRGMLFEERRCAATELCMFSAARCELVTKVILPAISAGKDVLLDRYWLSTVVYQGIQLWPNRGRAMDVLDKLALDFEWPSAFTVVVMTPADVILRRMQTRADQKATPFDPASAAGVTAQLEAYRNCYDWLRLHGRPVLQVSGEDEALPITIELIIKQLHSY